MIECQTKPAAPLRHIGGAIAGFAWLALPAVAPAANFTWAPTGSGDFNTAANWTPAGGPPNDTADVAVFDNEATGAVTFATPLTLSQLSFQNTSGALTLDLSSNELTLTNSNGISLRQSAAHVNDVTFTNGSIRTAQNTIRLADAANMKDNVVTLTGANTLLLSDHASTGASGIGNAAGADGNVLNIFNGATVTTNNTIRLGAIEGVVRTNAINVTNANLNLTHSNRPLILQSGAFNVTNSTVVIASQIDAAQTNNTGFVNFNSGTLSVRQTLLNNGQTFFIGDGGTIDADFRLIQGSAVLTAANGVQVRSNGSIGGAGTINANITGDVGARFGVTVDAPTESALTTVNGNFDASNFEVITLRFGDFPAELAEVETANEMGADPPLAFRPPVDGILVNGAFTHADLVVIDLAGYVAPQDMDYELRLIGWTSVAGALAPVSFVNGGPLAYEYRSDGLYVLAAAPEPTALGLFVGLGVMYCGSGRRRGCWRVSKRGPVPTPALR